MRVLVDVSFARRGPSGTQVYVDRLVPALRALGIEVAEAEGRRGRHLDLAAEAAWQARLARAARRADVLHHPLPAWAPTRTPQVVTVHDLAPLRFPEGFNARFRRFSAVAHRAAARAAAAVIAPSEATAADVRALWGVEPVVAPHGPGQAPWPASEAGGEKRAAPRHFLYVGDAEPRKNLERLLLAYARYRAGAARPLDLVLAGRATVAPAPGVRVERRPDLGALHRAAAALVVPSLHEGFGLPALEGMRVGTPVIASRIPALLEVCGDAAWFCDPRDVEGLAAALARLAAAGAAREDLRRRGLARAAAYSWERSAAAHLRAYERAVLGSAAP